MKGFRRSIGSRHDKPVHTGTSGQQSTGDWAMASGSSAGHAIIPPKKVIKAMHSYSATRPNELSFSKGDFFHVIGNEDDPSWYEASNPVTNARGLVPVDFFQVLEKTSKAATAKTTLIGPQSLDHPAAAAAASSSSSVPTAAGKQLGGVSPNALGLPPGRQPLYGIVQYDFVAERSDELDVHAGEPIIIIAQSNHEWFVAKPIGRLGGPGLIPVSFIEIRDASTGRVMSQDEVKEGLISGRLGVPKVEEWKKMTAEYKKASIPLGRFDFGDTTQPQQQQQQQQQKVAASAAARMSPIASSPNPSIVTPRMIPVKATVESFHYEDSRYWFLLRVSLRSPKGLGPMMHSSRVLYRLYDDFYSFQIALLDAFPAEAGRTGSQRILPLMPGPLSYVNDIITAQRRSDLDVYVKELCKLPDHIVAGDLVHDFFELKQGDVEVPRQSLSSSQSSPSTGHQSSTHHDAASRSAVAATTAAAAASVSASVSSSGQSSANGHDLEARMRQLRTNSRDDAPLVSSSSSSPRPPNTTRSSDGSRYDEADRLDDYYTQSHSSGRNSEQYGMRQTSRAASDASPSLAGDSYSSALQGRPQERQTNGQAASAPAPAPGRYSSLPLPPNPHLAAGFIKIKVFVESDLIAIRVPPDVTYAQLLEKLQEKLGKRISRLLWKGTRDGTTNGERVQVSVRHQDELDEIIHRNAKVVFFAE